MDDEGYKDRINVNGRQPRGMEQHGPNFAILICAIDSAGAKLTEHSVPALIDTGSERCCISPRMVPKMQGGSVSTMHISHIYGRVEERAVRGMITFSDGSEFVRDFAVLNHLDDYEVIIGRDVLREGRFFLDIGAASWWLQFRQGAH